MSKEGVKQVFFDANSGNHKAQNYLGSMYATGNGVNKDYIKAKAFFEKVITKSSNTTHVQRTQMSIGIMYYCG